MKPRLNMTLVFILTISVGTLIAAPSNGERKSGEIEKATKTLEKVERILVDAMENPLQGIPESLISKSEVIVIFPRAFQIAAGAFNGPGGRGIAMILNEDDSWSNPFFVTIREGRQGYQIGPQTSDIVLLFKDRDDFTNINSAEIALGGDVEVAAGPVQSGSSLNTNIPFESEIYSYHRSKGVFTGESIEGAILTYDNKPGDSLYSIETMAVDEIF